MALAQNLYPYSRTLDPIGWVRSGANVTTGQTDPFAGSNAVLLTDIAGAGNHRVYGGSPALGAVPLYTRSIYAKAGTRSWMILNQNDGGSFYTYFDLANGVLGTVATGVNGVPRPTITAVPGAAGWWRCSITGQLGPGGANHVVGLASGDTLQSYTADGAGTILVYGHQIVQANWAGPLTLTDAQPVNNGPIRSLVPSVQNLLTYSEQFDNAAWTKLATAVTPDAVVAPDGTTTADLCTANGGTSEHSMVQNTTPLFRGTVTGSVYLKYNGTQWAQVGSRQGAASRFASFDIQNGAVGTLSSNTSATITAIGNGWYRCATTWTSGGTEGGTDLTVAPILTNGGGSTYAQTGQSMYVWGAQLAPANWAGPYAKTVATAYNAGMLRSIA